MAQQLQRMACGFGSGDAVVIDRILAVGAACEPAAETARMCRLNTVNPALKIKQSRRKRKRKERILRRYNSRKTRPPPA
jgi:hypothetical protein